MLRFTHLGLAIFSCVALLYATNCSSVCVQPPKFCNMSKYRTLDGSCNNLLHPIWGAANLPYERLLPYNYHDGISEFPRSASGTSLPNARELSLRCSISKDQALDPKWTLLTQQWGQLLTHDLSMSTAFTQTDIDNFHLPAPASCCDSNGQLTIDSNNISLCNPILVPLNDPFHDPNGTKCLQFTRSATTRDYGCSPHDDVVKKISGTTAYMDLSMVYGNSQLDSSNIREFNGGRLKTVLKNGKEMPPQSPDKITCRLPDASNDPCYYTGDARANQNPQLLILQIILLREHNRLAGVLANLNPHWTDEIVYQEARRINIAQMQHISYNEYLPILLGKENMIKTSLIYPEAKEYVNDYNSSVNPSILDEHANAAFRHFHSSIRGYLELISEERKLLGTVRLSDLYMRPYNLDNGTTFDDLARGLTYQKQGLSDPYWDNEIRDNFLKTISPYGRDLRAIDIQRGRDHGLPTYVAIREACGLSVPRTFEDMVEYIPAELVEILQDMYDDPKSVELAYAGTLETLAPGVMVGPTFQCIIMEQFSRTRKGDRFFYENGDDPETAFTLEQLESIRQGSTVARLLCDNSDQISHMQPKAFELIGEGNELIPCTDLPTIDLSLWQDVNGIQ